MLKRSRVLMLGYVLILALGCGKVQADDSGIELASRALGLVTFEIRANGSPIPDVIEIYSIKVELPVNENSRSEVTVLGGPSSTSKSFEYYGGLGLGNHIEIFLGYDNSHDTKVFDGTIRSQRLSIDSSSGPHVVMMAEGKVVHATSTHPELTLTYGGNIIAFELRRDEGGRYQGSITVQGTLLVLPGQSIKVAGLGKVFGGILLVTAVTHIAENGNWLTTFTVGGGTDETAGNREALP